MYGRCPAPRRKIYHSTIKMSGSIRRTTAADGAFTRKTNETRMQSQRHAEEFTDFDNR